MIYFPILWILSILVQVLFFILFRKAEKKYNMLFQRYPGNVFARIKDVKKFINTSTETNKVRDFKLAIACLYFGRILFISPILIYFITAFME